MFDGITFTVCFDAAVEAAGLFSVQDEASRPTEKTVSMSIDDDNRTDDDRRMV